MILQFVLIRNFSAILFGTELILLIVTTSYFLGYSLGYYASNKISLTTLEIFSLLTFFFHLSFPFSLRFISGVLLGLDWNFVTLLFSVLIMAGAGALFYSLILPQFVTSEGPEQLPSLYRAELWGALGGLLLFFASTKVPQGTLLLMLVYLINFGLILSLLWQSKLILIVAFLWVGVYGALFQKLDHWSVSSFYRNSKEFKEVRALISTDSPYQRIEVIEEKFGIRHLYLDGIRHYGGDSLSDFNTYISELPASQIKNPTVLIVGSGSMESLYRVLPVAKKVDTVELDAKVIEVGQKFFKGVLDKKRERWLKEKWSLHIDDAKHFLKNTKNRYDLIVMDIAGPLQMQVALLYTEEFYKIAASKLTEKGVISVSLNGQLPYESVTAGRILKTLKNVFKEVMVLAPYQDSNFAYASQQLPFSKEEIEKELLKRGFLKARVYDNRQVLKELEGASYDPISQKKMDIVLRRGLDRLLIHYFRIDHDD